VAGEHLPDRFCQRPCEIDLGDFRAALRADAAFGALVALAVEGVRAGVDRSFISRQRRYRGPCSDNGPRRSLLPD